MADKCVVLDGTGHIAGRLGAHVAKKLLEGYTISVVCAESIILTGPIHRSKLRYKRYLNKRCLVKPSKGPYHYKEPSKLFTRVVRRMVPHKKKRGANALKRLSVFEGIPEELVNVPRCICPKALHDYKANPIRKKATYGELLSNFGWKHLEITERTKKRVLHEEEQCRREEELRKAQISKIRGSEEFRREVEKILLSIE